LVPSLIRTPGFAIYLTCRFILGLIVRAQALAIGYHLYELTDDPIALGYVGIAMFLPVIGFGLFAGDIADRANRAIVLSISSFFIATSSLGLLALAIYDVQITWPFYALTVLFGIALAFAKPAMPAFVAQLVPGPQLTNAIALSSGISQMASVIGPAAIGALLIFGPAAAYAALAGIALVATIMWFTIRSHAVGGATITDDRMISRITAGIRIVMRTPLILGVMSLDLFAVLLGSVMALLPVFARDILMIGPAGLGLLRAAPALGAALTAIILARVAIRRHVGPIMLLGVGVYGAAILVFGLSQSLILSLIALAISGAADILSNILRNTAIQLSAPNAIRGRVNAVSQVFVSGSNELGDFRAGVSAGLLGAVPAVVLGGLGTVAVAGLWPWLFPSLRKLDRMSELGDQGKTEGGSGGSTSSGGAAAK